MSRNGRAAWRRGGAAAAFALLALAVPAVPGAPASATASSGVAAAAVPARLEGICAAQGSLFRPSPSDAAEADAMMAGSLMIKGFPPQPLPDDIDWSRPALDSPNYQVQFQSLFWAEPLRREYVRTGNPAYLDRYRSILQDFARDNPDYTRPLTDWTWTDGPEGRRASVLGCAMLQLGAPDWLVAAAREQIRAMTDPRHYLGIGNHALMQNVGMITAGVAVGDAAAIDVAHDRAVALLPRAVSADGVSLEGSMKYHQLNEMWWREFRAVVLASDLEAVPGISRIDLMGRFGADSTLPDGTMVNFGDGFPATPSAYDPSLARDFAAYSPGYLFSRSRSTAGPAMLAVHYGQSYRSMAHGHRDAGSLELYAGGRLMVSDSGMYSYGRSFWRSWVETAGAHNVMTATGAAYDPDARSRLVRFVKRDGYLVATFALPVMKGVTWYRTIKQSLKHGWILVLDQVSSSTSRTWTQRWNLPDGVSYQVLKKRVDQTWGRDGRVSVIAVAGSPTIRLRQGVRTSDLRTTAGWRSYRYDEIEPAPSVDLIRTGTSWQVVTLIAPRLPGESPATVHVSDVRVSGSTTAVTVTTARGSSRTAISRLS